MLLEITSDLIRASEPGELGRITFEHISPAFDADICFTTSVRKTCRPVITWVAFKQDGSVHRVFIDRQSGRPLPAVQRRCADWLRRHSLSGAGPTLSARRTAGKKRATPPARRA